MSEALLIDRVGRDLARDEGEVLHAYQDHLGYWTIGIGRLIDPRRGGGISHEEALYLLGNDIQAKMQALDARIPWWRTLPEAHQRVLLNMAFNLGIDGLLGFKNTLAAFKRGDRAAAARGMRASRWAKQVGARAERLVKLVLEG